MTITRTVHVVIESETGCTGFEISVPSENINSERHCRKVLASGVEVACALLDAVYQKDDTDD